MVCHIKIVFDFVVCKPPPPKLLGNLKRNLQRSFPTASGPIGKDKSSQMPENFAATSVTAAQKQIDKPLLKQLFIKEFPIEKSVGITNNEPASAPLSRYGNRTNERKKYSKPPSWPSHKIH